MSIQITHIELPSYAGIVIRNSLFQKVGNTRLMVLLPGRGYTVNAPLLHYSFHIGWQNGYDVLGVQYGFHIAQDDLRQENIPDIHNESSHAVNEALKAGQYNEMVVVGKSLGTPIAAMIANQHAITSKCVLLTPIQSSHKLIQTVSTLAVIGTADPNYKPELAIDTDLVTWKVYDDLDHSLEKPGDLAASIAILGEIMQACADFILH